MTNQHPIIPPQELVQQWLKERRLLESKPLAHTYLATRAAQWGADQELDACCEWLEQNQGRWEIPMALRDARRPKPPSLKEQAFKDLDELLRIARQAGVFNPPDNIRRALEALPE